MHRLLITMTLAGLAIWGCADYDLLEAEEPDAVRLEVIGVSDTTVTLRWTRSDAEDFRSYAVYYGSNDIVDTTDKLADTLYFSQDTVKTVWNLDPAHSYYFRVVVRTTAGELSASNIVQATTLRDSKTREIVFVVDSLATTDTSVRVSWSDSWHTGPYRLFLDTAGTVDSLDTVLVRPMRVNDDTAKTLTGLKPNTAYSVRVYALDTEGNAEFGSNTVRITTRKAEPDSVTVAVVDSLTTGTSVTLRWTRNLDRDFARYVVYADTIRAVDTAKAARDTLTRAADTVAVVQGLRSGTTYWFVVHVVDQTGHRTAGNLDSATTLPGVPDSVTLSIDRAALTDSTATLRWTRSAAQDFGAYLLYWDTAATVDTSSPWHREINQVSDTSETVPLDTLARYRFAVYVRDTDGNMAKSNEVVNYAVVLHRPGVTDSSVVLSWTPSLFEGQVEYQLYRDTLSGVLQQGKPVNPAALTRSTTWFEDKTVVSGKKYFYRLFVYEGAAVSGSNEVEVVFP